MTDDLENIFTGEDILFAEQHPTLGPCYSVGQRVVGRFMEQFRAEHFAPLTEELAKAFQERIYADIDAHLLSDAESNLNTTMRRMVDGTVNALLTGETWALERYPFAKYHDGQKVREAIVTHCREQLQNQVITDLEAKIADLTQAVTRLRDVAWY